MLLPGELSPPREIAPAPLDTHGSPVKASQAKLSGDVLSLSRRMRRSSGPRLGLFQEPVSNHFNSASQQQATAVPLAPQASEAPAPGAGRLTRASTQRGNKCKDYFGSAVPTDLWEQGRIHSPRAEP